MEEGKERKRVRYIKTGRNIEIKCEKTIDRDEERGNGGSGRA